MYQDFSFFFFGEQMYQEIGFFFIRSLMGKKIDIRALYCQESNLILPQANGLVALESVYL